MTHLRHLSTIAFAALLAGCAHMPKMAAPAEPRAAASLASANSLPGLREDWPAADWWTGFGDKQLTALIDEALKGSPDIAAAAARIAAADSLAAQAGAALKPSAQLESSAGVNLQSRAQGFPPQFIPGTLQDNGRIAISGAWNPDLWGKNRAMLAAATTEAQAARVDADQARLMLTTGVASAYADLARLYAQRDVAEAALRVRRDTADITSKRFNAGIEARGPAQQAQARVPASQTEISAINEAITITGHRIAALLGAGPDRGASITRPAIVPDRPGIPANAGLDLVGRRPDLVSARLHAEAMAARIKVARADFYPNISLSALVGTQALGLDNLFSGFSKTANAGVALSLPIFDGGRIEARYLGARADYDGAVARYDATLVAAVRDVADAATSRAAADAQLADLRAALSLSTDAAKAARARWLGGLSNQLPVLVAEDAMIANRRAVADQEARRLMLDIALIRALGGGWQMPSKGE